MKTYFAKMKGVAQSPPKSDNQEVLLALFGSALALGLIGTLHHYCIGSVGLPLLMAPFGASVVLVFGAFQSALAQPRNVVGGHIISAFIGVTVFQVFGETQVLTVSLAVPLAITGMHLTKTLHPPGGATAFVAAAGGSEIHALGYWYVLMPCALGSLFMVTVALLTNNFLKKHRYPQFWW